MGGRIPNDPVDFYDLLADPMIRLVMQADGVGERELREICERTAITIKGQQKAVAPETASISSAETDAYRPGVGIMLLNSSGHVFVGQRRDVIGEAWQMPQGGVERDETPLAAALRELDEEIGTRNVDVVIATKDWLSYEFPAELLALMPTPRWKGQTQKWFLMRFLGIDTEIRIATEHPEFSDWKWVPADFLIELIVPFKRELYRRVLLELAPHFSSSFQHRETDRTSPNSRAR